MLTGEPVSYGLVRPRTNFDPADSHWGAVQILARYSAMTLDRAAFNASLAAATASRRAQSFVLAANWFPNGFIKYYATFERTAFDHGPNVVRPAEHSVVVRAQVGF
jgi:phosphate-selective porin OprO/OprP